MTPSSTLRIAGGTVHDPANGIDGDVRDICIADGRVVADLPAGAPVLDARGMIVMPGGVDIHSHVASSSCNHARRLLPEEHTADPVPAPRLAAGHSGRSGTGGTVPSTFTTGYRYAGLGYTTVFDAAIAPLTARHTHHEMSDTPCIDAGCFVLMGNDDYLLKLIDAGERNRARDYAAWLLGATGGYAIKIVNPGGVEAWKTPQRNITGLDEPLGSSRVTARGILETLTDAANTLGLPHPVHIHCQQSRHARQRHDHHGELPGAGRATGALHPPPVPRVRRRGRVEVRRPVSSSDWINIHPELSVDVGQVMFGPATTVTADGPVEYLLHKSSGRKWVNIDVELETGCGIVPLEYKEKAAVSALQWAIGLELFLLAKDPWRVVLSTDHPNGGSFLAYPQLIQLLMDRTVPRRAPQAGQPEIPGG